MRSRLVCPASVLVQNAHTEAAHPSYSLQRLWGDHISALWSLRIGTTRPPGIQSPQANSGYLNGGP
jgi:hypothetical protein